MKDWAKSYHNRRGNKDCYGTKELHVIQIFEVELRMISRKL